MYRVYVGDNRLCNCFPHASMVVLRCSCYGVVWCGVDGKLCDEKKKKNAVKMIDMVMENKILRGNLNKIMPRCDRVRRMFALTLGSSIIPI